MYVPIDDNGVAYDDYGPFHTRAAALTECVALFHRVDVAYGLLADRADITELTGRDLVCWCPLDQPCHADILLVLANPTPTKETP